MPSETIVTNIDPSGGRKGPKKQATQKPSKYDEEDEPTRGGNPPVGFSPKAGQPAKAGRPQGPEEQTCGFCGRYDEGFNEESLDIHYWKDCPMLA